MVPTHYFMVTFVLEIERFLDMQKKKHIPSHLAWEAFRGLNAMLYICMTDWPHLDIFSDDASNWEIIVDVKDGEILWS